MGDGGQRRQMWGAGFFFVFSKHLPTGTKGPFSPGSFTRD